MAGLGFDYRALAMSSGVGSASMMTAASSSLIALMPENETTIAAYAAASQLLTSFFRNLYDGIYCSAIAAFHVQLTDRRITPWKRNSLMNILRFHLYYY